MTFKPWWSAEAEKVHTVVLDYVASVERAQFDLYDKFAKLEAMYDPNAPGTRGMVLPPSGHRLSNVVENVIASNIDTVTAVIAATDVRARFMTEDADWSHQRRAKHLEWYSDAIVKRFGVAKKCRRAFRSSSLKGTGVLKIYADEDKQICVDIVAIDDIVVDEAEARTGEPKQMHQRMAVDRETLKRDFPDHETQIDAAQTARGGSSANWRLWAGYRPVETNECVVIESWHLPLGKSRIDSKTGKETNKRYRAGRHTITIDGCDLLDEEWTKPTFPFVRILWGERETGWYGISLAERIAGIQNALNKRNWAIERLLAQGAAPTTFVRTLDASLAVKTANSAGSIVPYKGELPKTVTPPQVNPETYQSRIDLKNAAFEESGVSRMTAQAAKPAGIDSGVAMREYRDQTTQRFAMQEKAYEQFVLDVVVAILAVCKELDADAPAMMRQSKFGARKIEWSEVDMGDVAIQIAASSTLSKTPAGRMQTVLEWAQAGIISKDAAARLMDHPDLEREMDVVTAGIDSVEYALEMIMDGEQVAPEPYMPLDLCVSRGQREYLLVMMAKAPEEILEALRTFITQAADMLNPPQPAAVPGAMPGAAPGMPGPMPMAPAGPAPGLAAMDNGAAPNAALAAQAMQLRSV